MALLPVGTKTTTSLSGLVFTRQPPSVADVATMNKNILNDLVNGNPIWPGAYRLGLLSVPNRGTLITLPGDVIAYDSTGWPILISANSIANGSTSWDT